MCTHRYTDTCTHTHYTLNIAHGSAKILAITEKIKISLVGDEQKNFIIGTYV